MEKTLKVSPFAFFNSSNLSIIIRAEWNRLWSFWIVILNNKYLGNSPCFCTKELRIPCWVLAGNCLWGVGLISSEEN